MPVLSNTKHELFAQALAKGKSQADAYAAAGYKPSEPHASRLASSGKVQARVAELAGKGAERAIVDIGRTLAEMARIGFSDLRKAFDGNRLLHPSEWPDDVAAAISSVEVVVRPIGDGDVEHIHKIKFWDKNSALEKIAKHLGMFIERHELSGPADGDGKPTAIEFRLVRPGG